MSELKKSQRIHVVGGGLAGCEAAWQAVRSGIPVTLHEMRPQRSTPAHKTGDLAELVCSNTFKSMKEGSAPALLKAELEAFDSLIIRCAKAAAIPAGQALGVDRTLFAQGVTEVLKSHPLVTICEEEVTNLPSQAALEHASQAWIIATGPLSSDGITAELATLCGEHKDRLFFYDAIAPVIAAESINMDECFFANRYDEESDDYLNISLDKAQYEKLIDDILNAEKAPLHAFEDTKYFECCLPIEVMAERGRDTLRFGPLKPVGFTNPKTGHRPWALIQLRRENAEATMFSMVGFQTKMKWPEQERVFRSLPGLKEAEFFRLGSVHRNTYLNSPEVLNKDLSFKSSPQIFLAGQITGVEGYTESCAMGAIAGRAAVAKLRGTPFPLPPKQTMIGALLHYVTHGNAGPFQPMNTNMGLLPPLARQKKESKIDRRLRQFQAAQECFSDYFAGL